MFNNKCKELLEIIAKLKHEKELAEIKQEYTNKENKNLLSEKDKKIHELEKENSAKITMAIKEHNLNLQQERDLYQARCDILERAFENLGFDVKDMKDILNKLVDGLIAKNEIKLIK